ncbi:MAG: GntR family transcriptional regulator [Desulfobacteraceae bacterium]
MAMVSIMRDKGIPLYYQIGTVLKERILSGELQAGAPLPGEEALSREYGVSRITVRRALAILETEGLIIRQRGRGTFVAERSARVRPTRFSGTIEELIAQATSAKVKILDYRTVEPPEDVAEKLNLPEGEKVVRIDKVRLIDGLPFSVVVNFLPRDTGEKISPEDLNEKPLLVVLEEKLGIEADEAVQSVEATIASAEVASLLDIRVGAPLLKVERTVFDVESKPVEHVSVLYRADKYFYTVRLKRNQSEDAAGWAPQIVFESGMSPHKKRNNT